MKTLGIIAQKGGTGKTTLSVHLAVQATRAGLRVLLLDMDPQASGFGVKTQTDSRPESEPGYAGTKAARDTHQRRHAQAATTQGSSRALIVLSVAAVAIAAVTLVMLKSR